MTTNAIEQALNKLEKNDVELVLCGPAGGGSESRCNAIPPRRVVVRPVFFTAAHQVGVPGCRSAFHSRRTWRGEAACIEKCPLRCGWSPDQPWTHHQEARIPRLRITDMPAPYFFTFTVELTAVDL